MGRTLVGLPTNGSPDCTSVPPVGEPAEYPPGLLPLSDLAIPICPLPLDNVVDGFRAVEVVPHPRYPAPSVSLISEGSSPLLLAPPTTGSVGSLLGLNPYSSTSFLRSSSASFRCFRLRQKKSAASTINATAATGTTTATAILLPGESPPESFEDGLGEVFRVAIDVLDEDCLDEEVRDVDSDGSKVGVDVVSVVITTERLLLSDIVTNVSVVIELNVEAAGEESEEVEDMTADGVNDELDCSGTGVDVGVEMTIDVDGGELDGEVSAGKLNEEVEVEIIVKGVETVTRQYSSR